MKSIFNQKNTPSDIQKEWGRLGKQYAAEVNAMVAFGETHGWENWKGREPEDKREHLADRVVQLLKEANKEGEVEAFRRHFPPAHAPLIQFFKEKGQNIEQLHFIENEKIVFLTGTAYQKRQAYLLNGRDVLALEPSIDAIGKSKRNNVFAILAHDKIVTTQGWQGPIITSFDLQDTKGLGVTELIPFNDGTQILLITSEGIYLLSEDEEQLLHPEPDAEDEDWSSYIDMENATLSNDNQYIVVGDQCSDHRVLDRKGRPVAQIGPQSSYPHYCLFSADDTQLITNACHFYNGITIGVSTENLAGLKVEAYQESEAFQIIDEEMRVYAGVTTQDLYILGDAYGYVKAFNKQGKYVWRHFVGSTIGGLALSDDERILWVGSCTGMVHKLRLGEGHRDDHTIGNGEHYEEFRLIVWKEEPIMIW